MENLLGKYRGVATENMDAYFKAKGMVWALRKMILSLMNPKNAVREFCKNDDGTFSYKDTGSTRTQVEWKFKIGDDFVACSYDGKDHKIKFEFDSSGQKLLEKHVMVEDPSQEQTYEHYLDDGRLIWQLHTPDLIFSACPHTLKRRSAVLRIKDTEAKWIYEREA